MSDCEHRNEIAVGAHGRDGYIEKEFWCPDCGRRECKQVADKDLKLPSSTVMR